MVLLKLIAAHHPTGVALGVLAQAAGLDRATAYRLATSLVESGMVEREQRLYRLGLDAMQLGLAAMKGAPILDRCRPVMQRLARRTEDTISSWCAMATTATASIARRARFRSRRWCCRWAAARARHRLGGRDAAVDARRWRDCRALRAHTSESRRTGCRWPAAHAGVRARARPGWPRRCSLVNEGVSGVGMRFEITPGNFAAVSGRHPQPHAASPASSGLPT